MNKYNIIELSYPEQESYNDNDIVFWKKGNSVDGYWYKAECPNLHCIELGDTKDEAVTNVITMLETFPEDYYKD